MRPLVPADRRIVAIVVVRSSCGRVSLGDQLGRVQPASASHRHTSRRDDDRNTERLKCPGEEHGTERAVGLERRRVGGRDEEAGDDVERRARDAPRCSGTRPAKSPAVAVNRLSCGSRARPRLPGSVCTAARIAASFSSVVMSVSAFSRWAKRPRQSFGTSAVTVIGSFVVGCRNVRLRACSAIAVAERVVAAVLRVAVDRAPAAGELHAELVLAAGVRAEFEPRQPVVPAADLRTAAAANCAPGVSFGTTSTRAVRLVLLQPVFERAGVRGRPRGCRPSACVLDHRPVHLLDHPLAELLAEPGRGLARAGEQQHPAHRLVEPVDDAEEHVAGLLVLLLEVRLREPVDRLVLAVEVRGRPPGRLVQRQAVVVFVQDVEAVRERHAAIIAEAAGARNRSSASSHAATASRSSSHHRVPTSWTRERQAVGASTRTGARRSGSPVKLHGELNAGSPVVSAVGAGPVVAGVMNVVHVSTNSACRSRRGVAARWHVTAA